jgi:hypothetical protein
MINISPIFGQSRAKKKEIIADSKIAKVEFIKTDFMEALSKKLRYLFQTGWIYRRRGGWKWSRVRKQ